ncbi:MAG: class I SAM-dependent methyltransferase, partial [Thermoanaerobaculia bacterium]
CAVCGSSERRRLFAKQGFAYHRCAGCSHVYISPGLRRAAYLDLEAEGESNGDGDGGSPYLEAQRLYAEPICQLLRLRSPGARLLDLGFGEGHLLRTARAFGFEVYGMDASRQAVELLEPEFGRHVVCGAIGAVAIPWSDLDVIVMSHVLEHLRDPAAALAEVYGRLKPGGLLYVAVPDMGSVQFRMFGKNWDAVSPLVHLQGFNEASLGHLLARCGFVAGERVDVPLPVWVRPLRWMQLVRQLGGNEAGELAVLAERPETAGAS